MTEIGRDIARTILDKDERAHLVEVLPRSDFEKAHLPGAINVPLEDDFDRVIQEAVPDKSDPVIVYCASADCNASPKAAKRLDELGYEKVYDYAAGKADWQEAGLPLHQGST